MGGSTKLHDCLKRSQPVQRVGCIFVGTFFSKTIGVFRFTPKLCPFAYRATAALLQTSLELSHGLAHAMLLECKWAGRKRGNERKKLVVCACGYKEGRCRYRLLHLHHLPLTTKFFRILYDQALTRKEDLDPKRRSFVPLHPETKENRCKERNDRNRLSESKVSQKGYFLAVEFPTKRPPTKLEKSIHTVDGRNPAPVVIPLFTRLYTSQVVGLGISEPSTVVLKTEGY